MIHCIGDSHSAVFSGKEEMQPVWPERSDDRTPFFKSYRIGASTAYQLENKKTIIDEIININVDINKDYVLFCFGEVDVRAHLIKQINIQNKSIIEIVKECVDRYFSVILKYKQSNIKVIAWGVIASWHESKQYTGGPSFGTCLERNIVTKEFNRYLKELCDKNDVGFISIFNEMIDENMITKSEYLDDWQGSHIHLNQKTFPIILKLFENYIN